MQTVLDERVDALERQVRALTEMVTGKTPAKKDWRLTFGSARDDEGFDEMVRLGAEIRQKDREAAGADADSGH